jgi:sugar/nucleoside kinase (ribokinase family)
MIAARPDLLIVGGLAVDRLADGSTVAGGSVLHGARAVVASGRRVATITAAGDEPEAVAAIAELAGLGRCLATPAPTSIHYAIHEEGGRRRLVLEAASGDLPVSAVDVAEIAARAVLLAPIAGEISPKAIRACAPAPVRVAALQGWLRHLIPGDEALPLPLDALPADLRSAVAALDALVASDEDLAAPGSEPRDLLQSLRAFVGPRPALLLTTGADGACLDDPATGIHYLSTPRRLDGVSTIGAGDVVAALLSVGLGAGLDPPAAAAAAMIGTAEVLAARP